MHNLKSSCSARGSLFALALALSPLAAHAACDVEYEVQASDTFYSIAQAHYGTRVHWKLLFDANQSASGTPSLTLGNVIYIPCPEGQEPTAALTTPEPASSPSTDIKVTAVEPVIAPAPSAPLDPPKVVKNVEPIPVRTYPENAELRLLTGGNYAPFTDKSLPGQGLITEILHGALDTAPSAVSYSVTWDDDWSKHLFPLLNEKTFDMGFPWLQPDCQATPRNELCLNFHFSEPLMSMPIMLFVRENDQFEFRADADILGKSICRPKGYFLHDLDSPRRRWISNGKITLVEGNSPRDCFDKVLMGEVDAASVNLFAGAEVILDMGARNQIVPLERPISQQGLHVVISKRHWRGTVHLYRINAGLEALKANGQYDEIIARHMMAFQSRLQ